MSANDKQQQRMRGYFIDATKEILRGEGLKVVSARNIAAQAGYSYATLYNYFKDINSLVFECVQDFQKEIEIQISSATAVAAPGRDRIKAGLTAWVNYFVQYPGIFELFFLERMGDIGHKQGTAEFIVNSIKPAITEGMRDLENNGIITPERAKDLGEVFRYNITGLMLFYSNRRYPPDYPGLLKALNNQISLILNMPDPGKY
ncbi:MAG: TetR/AcrR family transcriptional regulator [Spirochaetales bacterium]|nr:TetR/AcrR family transcriptional regulator [Spirochaetales bacterium]